jgi:hypothetical protein
MTQRRRLDLHLAEQAVAAGADFRDGAAVSGIEIGGKGVSVRVDDSPIRASFVVGADGARRRRQAAGLGAGIVRGVALEGNVPWGALERSPYAGTAWVEIGIVPGGYGWVFPKGDHANLGGRVADGGPEPAGASRPAARAHGVDPSTSRASAGTVCRCELGAQAARGRVLLVGDAAGLVDPLSGDGMYEAFISAPRIRRDRRRDARERTNGRWRQRSIVIPPRRGRRSARWIATRARVCGRCVRQGLRRSHGLATRGAGASERGAPHGAAAVACAVASGPARDTLGLISRALPLVPMHELAMDSNAVLRHAVESGAGDII